MNGSAIVIIGAGHGGVQLAGSLREAGHGGAIHLIDNESDLPYQRSALSKSFLTEHISVNHLDLRSETYYQDRNIELHRGDACVRIDREACTATLASGVKLSYDHLVLATGARPRVLNDIDGNFDNVVPLHTLRDAGKIRGALANESCDIAIMRGGFIGLELAASATSLGHRVTVIEALERPMARAVSPELSRYVSGAHRSAGVDLVLGRGVVALRGHSAKAHTLVLDTGEHVKADLVVVGIGVLPNVELAADAGLDADNGIVVDHQLLTSDPRISALADCAVYPSVHARGPVRLESVQNAVDHAKFIAARLMGTPSDHYHSVPWFWTHQYDLKIQMAGIYRATDTRMVLGDPGTGAFSVLHFHDEVLRCVESVNRVSDHMAARRILAADQRPRPADVVTRGFDLKSFARANSGPALAPTKGS